MAAPYGEAHITQFMFLLNNLGKRNKITIILTIFLLSFFVLIQVALASDYGLTDTLGAIGGEGRVALENIKNEGIPRTVGRIIGAGLAFIGIAFFILMIYGGFLWMTARGNEEQVKKSIDLIISAVVGLIIIAAAYLITKFIGVTILNPLTG